MYACIHTHTHTHSHDLLQEKLLQEFQVRRVYSADAYVCRRRRSHHFIDLEVQARRFRVLDHDGRGNYLQGECVAPCTEILEGQRPSTFTE